MKEQVYIILGPTASGKTATAIELAKLKNGEIISADSMQVYREMDIGTAKPDMDERQGIVHHMIDVAAVDEPYSVAMFQQAAKGWIRDILSRGKTPVLVGGTGLYLNSITYRLDFTDTSYDLAFRQKLEKRNAQELHRILSEKDPQAAERIHENDKKRIIRRLEILNNGDGKNGYEFRRPNDEYDFVMAGLTTERKVLYERINRRVDLMMQQGLLQEAETLYHKYGDTPTSMQAIGYKELIEYFKGNMPLDEAVAVLKRNTRRYAKRQLTWFRRDERVCWYDISSYANAAELAHHILNKDRTAK